MRIRDSLTAYNERVKYFASLLNALAIGLVGFALVRPLVDAVPLSVNTGWWCLLAFAFHLGGHYVLGRIEKENANDGL
ncbi:MAG: hypothetical protein ACU0CI_14285 [Shimia sp.]